MNDMKFSQNRILIMTAMLIALACFFAIYLRLFTQKELWGQMFAAILGVVITAIITMFLLRGQSVNEVESERATKIFEEKLRIYQDYLRFLCDAIKDHKLSEEEKISLKFQTSYVAMHCESKYIETVSNAIKKLIDSCCSDTEGENLNQQTKSNSPDSLLDSLFCIVEAFRKDLYGDDFQFNNEHKQHTLENFSYAYRDANSDDCNKGQEQQRITVDLNVLSNSLTNMSVGSVLENKSNERSSEQRVEIEDTKKWDDAVLKWKEEGWHIEGMSEQYDGFKIVKDDGNPGFIDVGFWESHYFIEAAYNGDADFLKPLKWEKGGRRSKGQWWQYFVEPYFNIAEGKFVETFKSDKKLQQYIIDNIEQLKDIINRYHRTATWKSGVGNYHNWKIFIWYWDLLCCELSSKEEGTPFMDIIEKENSGNVLIKLANRKWNKELLQKTLKRIGCYDKEINADGYVILEEVSSNEANIVSERARYWMKKING